jgi:hypothetical protein
MAFIYLRTADDLAWEVAEKDILTPPDGYEALEVELSIQEIAAKFAATGAPVYSVCTWDRVGKDFTWTEDFFVVEILVGGSPPPDPVEIDGDGVASELFAVKKKNLRTGEYDITATDVLDLVTERGRFRDADDTQNIGNVQLAAGEASFRLRSVAETVSTRMSVVPQDQTNFRGAMVNVKFI